MRRKKALNFLASSSTVVMVQLVISRRLRDSLFTNVKNTAHDSVVSTSSCRKKVLHDVAFWCRNAFAQWVSKLSEKIRSWSEHVIAARRNNSDGSNNFGSSGGSLKQLKLDLLPQYCQLKAYIFETDDPVLRVVARANKACLQ